MAEAAGMEAAVAVESAVSDGDAAAALQQAAALAALGEALAALDRFVASYAFANSSQEMMVRASVGTLRGMHQAANEDVGATEGVKHV